MTAHAFRLTLVALACVGVTSVATAQNAPSAERATDLGIVVGSSTADQAGAMVAGTAGYRVAPWATVEGRGTWFAGGSDTFAADLGMTGRLPGRGALVPFVGGGFGVYQSRAETGGVITTDPAYRVTGGLEFQMRRHLLVRPEASLLLVRGNDRRETMFLFGLQFGYRFEDRPITPARRHR
jgi:hypothetical protein